jgi:hypothetical protein
MKKAHIVVESDVKNTFDCEVARRIEEKKQYKGKRSFLLTNIGTPAKE